MNVADAWRAAAAWRVADEAAAKATATAYDNVGAAAAAWRTAHTAYAAWCTATESVAVVERSAMADIEATERSAMADIKSAIAATASAVAHADAWPAAGDVAATWRAAESASIRAANGN